jgi:hypothetical protein
MKQAAIDRMKGFFDSEDNYKVEGDDFIITFSGAVADVNEKVNAWLLKAVTAANEGEEYVDEDMPEYFSIEEHPFETSSFLTTGIAYEVDCNFYPVLGDVQMKVEGADGFFGSKYYEGVSTVEGLEGEYVSSRDDYFSVFETKVSVLGLIIGIASVLVLLAGIVLLILSLKPFKQYLAESKERKAQAKLAAQAAQPVPTPVGVTSSPYAQPEAPVVPEAPTTGDGIVTVIAVALAAMSIAVAFTKKRSF